MEQQANTLAMPPQRAAAPLTDTARKRSYILDWVLIVVCAALAGGLSTLPPSANILFRAGPTGPGEPLVNPDDYMAYPDRDEIIPTWYFYFSYF